MFHLILLQFRIFRNRVRSLTFLDEIKAAILIFFGLFFLAGIYWGAWRLLSYLNGVAIIGPLLTNKLIALVFLTSFSMVIFSSLITAFNTLFFSRDLPWLVSTPLPIEKIFAFKSAATFLYSSWMVFIALLPFIVALAQVKNAGFAYFLWTFAMLMPFFAVANLIGITISLFLMKFFPSRKTRDMLLFLSVIFITAIYMMLRFIQPERLVKPDGLEVVSQYLAYLDAPTAVYLPSWWITAGMFGVISRNFGETLFYFSLLAGTFAVLLSFVNALSRKLYFSGWADSGIIHSEGRACRESYTARGLFGAFISKDIKVFFRDASQWSQLLVLVALILIYLFSIYKLPLDTMYLQNLVSFFNVGLIGFILSAVALRFIFPAISLEGGSLWLLKSSPMRISGLLWEKLIFGGVPVMILGTVLSLFSGLLLKADFTMMLMLLFSSLTMSVGLSAMAASFGAIFPKFKTANIAEIESSAGGIFYMVTSLFYIGLNIALWAVPVQMFYRHKFGGMSVPPVVYVWIALALVIVNAIFIVFPLTRAVKALERIEA
ncbi:MAG: hypothetical protein ABII64_06385 [Elusimicrobiota bacterium]